MLAKDCTFKDPHKIEMPEPADSPSKSYSTRVVVALPVYNDAKYIPRCIESIANQEDKNFMVIACDDGSTDNTYESLKEHKEKHKDQIREFTILQNECNLGIGRTINRIYDFAICDMWSDFEYMVWVGIDDELYPDYIKEMLIRFDNSEADVVMSVWKHGRCGDKEMTPNLCDLSERYFGGGCIMHKKEVYLIAGPYMSMPGEDYMFATKIKLFDFNVETIPKALYRLDHRDDGVSGEIGRNIGNYCLSTRFAKHIAKKYNL